MEQEKKCPDCNYGYLAIIKVEKQFKGYIKLVRKWACDECLHTEPA